MSQENATPANKHPDQTRVPLTVWLAVIALVAVVAFLAGVRFREQAQKEAIGGPAAKPGKITAIIGAGKPVVHSGSGLVLGEHTISEIAEQASRSVVHIDVAAKLPEDPKQMWQEFKDRRMPDRQSMA